VEYTGVSGNIKFDAENGDAVRNTAYIKSVNTANNNWDFVKEQSID
jgi:branched-chain amino acid transport system substrate-binding protein